MFVLEQLQADFHMMITAKAKGGRLGMVCLGAKI